MIRTQEDWWKVLCSIWDHVIYTIPNSLNYDLNELATDTLCNDGMLVDGRTTFLGDLLNAKRTGNHERIRQYLQAFWSAAPDQSWIHNVPGWYELCDLCSEYWVFTPELLEGDK
jgi:hypothetical protein